MEILELKQMLEQISDARAEALESKFEIINTKLDGINNRLDKLNGKVAEHERIIHERSNCAYKVTELSNLPDKIRRLEDDQLSQKSVKRYLVGAVVLMGVVSGIIFSILQYVSG